MSTAETTKRLIDLVSNYQLPTQDQYEKIIKQEYDNIIKYLDNLQKFDKYAAYNITQMINEITEHIKNHNLEINKISLFVVICITLYLNYKKKKKISLL